MESPVVCSNRSSATPSDAPSYESLKSISSRGKADYSHPLYSATPQKRIAINITSCELEESRFSSCSTSPSSSSESLNTFPAPGRYSRLSAAPSALSTVLSASSSTRSSRPASSASSRFADEHYPLISSVVTAGKLTDFVVLEMAHAFNQYIRALNSCYNYSLTIDDDEVPDFLFFNQTLFNILSQHLKVDQQCLQPLLHRPVSSRCNSKKSLSIYDDDRFHASLHAWANYIHDSATIQYFSGDELQAHICSFAPTLVQHLHYEVAQLNSLVNEEILMPAHLSKIWSKFEETLSDKFDLYTDAALLVGCRDRYFTVNGQRSEQRFPRLPLGSTMMIKKWYTRKYDGAWRYCSSDFRGRRRVINY